MRFTPSFMDEIRDRVPISDVVGSRVTWDKRKTNASRGDYWACCPFHGEKSPSFHCEDKKGRYYCFGCGASGDHFRFLTELEGVSFPEAVERIAGMAGVAMPAADPEAEKREEQRASLYDVMELATKYFEAQLQLQANAGPRAYLRDRGLSAATLAKFRIGYAPNDRKALKEHLSARGVERDQIEACGLVVHGDDIPVSYDRFRDRIMFPIEDPQGRVIAFGGRALSKDVPAKYLNSPEGPLFHKSDVLFNFKRACQGAGKDGTLIAVEGYMDVIALDQFGITNAVAPLGTALTESQMAKMWRVTGEPVLCFDGDGAGLRAAYRSLELAMPELKPGKSMRFALLPQGQDPDDLVNQSGADAFNAIIAQARSAADMLWLRETGGRSFDTPERRAQLEADLRQATSAITDEAVRRHYQQEMRERVAAFFGMETRANKAGGAQNKSNTYGQSSFGRANAKAGGRRLAVSDRLSRSRLLTEKNTNQDIPVRDAAILSAVIHHPDLIADYFDVFLSLNFQNAQSARLRQVLIEAYAANQARTREELLADKACQRHAATIAAVDEIIRQQRLWVFTAQAAFEDARDAFNQAVKLHQRAGGLHKELRAAEAALASDPSETNYNRLVSIQDQLRQEQGLDALIEGFGQLSGRPARGF